MDAAVDARAAIAEDATAYSSFLSCSAAAEDLNITAADAEMAAVLSAAADATASSGFSCSYAAAEAETASAKTHAASQAATGLSLIHISVPS